MTKYIHIISASKNDSEEYGPLFVLGSFHSPDDFRKNYPELLRSYIVTDDGHLEEYKKPERMFRIYYDGTTLQAAQPQSFFGFNTTYGGTYYELMPNGDLIFQTPEMLEVLREENRA